MTPSTCSTASAATRTGPARPVHLFLAGVGAVGSALLTQIDRLPHATFRLLGACTSRKTAWRPETLVPDSVRASLERGRLLEWPRVMDRLTNGGVRPLIFVDATGSAEVADRYETLFEAGIHVVTPSKIANAQSQDDFDRLHRVAATHDVAYRYETTVGAGLPLLQTIRDFVSSGDSVHKIRGAVSGTLTCLFSELRGGTSFSEAVRTTIRRGYAEPDVRDDLSGTDVARKFLILARTAGRRIGRDQIRVESLVPAALHTSSYDAFLNRLTEVDELWNERSQTAAEKNSVLQYVGRFEEGRIDVGVEAVSANTAFGALRGQENLFEITTDRYSEHPLTIQGPGAGPRVTAAGVLADVLDVARTAVAA